MKPNQTKQMIAAIKQMAVAMAKAWFLYRAGHCHCAMPASRAVGLRGYSAV